MTAVEDILRAARHIRDQRYPDAAVVFAAGSLLRGEGTAHSDLDLVVVYRELPSAYRESFRFANYPVEAFVHDPATLSYFILEVDRPTGVPALARMVTEGVEIPGPTDLSEALKTLAASVLAGGPPSLTPEDLEKRRYQITDLLDDLRDARSREELVGTAARLFEALADYHLRAQGSWSGSGKAIPRALTRADPALAVRYARSFDDLFTGADVRGVIALTEELLAAQGGLLFDGYRSEAPATWRRARPWIEDHRANAPGACHIRDYRDDDREAIRACIVGLQEFERRIDDRLRPGEAMATAYLDQTIERCRTADGRIFVAEDTGQLAGFAAILARVPFEALDDPPGAYALITDLFVREPFRRRGVGRALIAAAERHARTAGATELRIGVLSENGAALALYEKAGFTGYLLTLTKRLQPDVSTRRRA